MVNKRGIELSVNFLVVLIISIAVIGFGIKFVYNIVGETRKLEQVSGEQLDAKIEGLICADEDKVCIGKDIKKIRQGKSDVFGLKILNIGNADKTFNVYVQVPSPNCGVDKSNAAINGDIYCKSDKPNAIKIIHGTAGGTAPAGSSIYSSFQRPVAVPKKEERTIAIAFEVPKTLQKSGTYIFNVRVRDSTAQPADPDYASTKKIYVEVP